MDHLNVIVPYRNREEHKKNLINVLHRYLTNSSVESFRIYIVEQDDDQPFNKGCLLNIGFLETYKNENEYYCFNDVDTLPKSSKANYGRPPANTIVHPYGHWHCLSNIFFADPESFKKMNGFSTKYWGWGFEDTHALLRAKVGQVNVSRLGFTERFNSDVYYETDDQRPEEVGRKMGKMSAKINQALFYNSLINPDGILDEGITTTEYEILGKEEFPKYTHIRCTVKNKNNSAKYIEAANEFFGHADQIKTSGRRRKKLSEWKKQKTVNEKEPVN